MNATELWEKTWNEDVHTTEDAVKRMVSAKSAKLTPIEINKDDMYGYFQGRSGKYETFLDHCNCIDFNRTKKPCKHIYRLAIELGVYEKTGVKSDSKHIVTPTKERYSFADGIELVEKLDEDTQRLLVQIFDESGPKILDINIPESDSLNKLIELGLVVDTTGLIEEITWGKAPEIVDLLRRNGIKPGYSARKAELIALCGNNLYEESKEEFGAKYYRTVHRSDILQYRDISNYLKRKWGIWDRSYFSEYYVPHDEELLSWLPQDKITEELNKRGYIPKTYGELIKRR